MGNHTAGIALLHDGFYRVVVDASGGGQHATGLVDHQEPLVLVDGLQFHALESQRLGVWVDVQPLQHPGQDGLALATAGRVVVQMMAQLGPGCRTPPELSHADRFQPLLIGILQQFRSTAVARTTWGQRIFPQQFGTRIVFLPDGHQVLLLATGVQQLVLVEQPQLEVLGHLF